ncbi:MAG: hypothetical protein ACK5H2_13840 [Beutenbergiaceae bacterium]
MSAMPARAPAAGSARRVTIRRRWRPRLRIVRAPSAARSRLPFLSLCLAILGGSLLGALALNTAIATTGYEISQRQRELAELTQMEQQLSTQVNALASPAQLALAAGDLGMVPAEGLSYIDLADGTISPPAGDLIEDGAE